MDLSQRPELEQRQTLHLTTELRQGIAMLQLNALDLSDYVRDRIEDNPVLAIDDDDARPSAQVGRDDESADLQAPNESAMSVADANRTIYERMSGYTGRMSTDALLEARGHGSPERFGDERRDLSQRDFSFDRFLASPITLYDHLTSQLNMLDLPRDVRLIGEYIIGNLDANGYLKLDIEELTELLGADEGAVRCALAQVQSLQPAGVAARSLAECLRLQLDDRGLLDPPLEDLLEHHLGELEKRSAASVAHSMGVSPEAMQDMLEVIRTCNPRPGAAFESGYEAIWPEVVVEGDGSGGYRVVLQDLDLPNLRIDESYYTVAAAACDNDVARYVKDKIREAEGVIEGLAYRRATLYKVACCIVESQYEFLEEGFERLRPLTMAQVAEIVGVAESTVSRVVNGNYMQTPRGTFELKFFFQNAVSSTGDAEVAAHSVKRRIRELIESEDSQSPLSDQAISEQLLSDGVTISRRTVAKYRTEMGIPVRAARKKN